MPEIHLPVAFADFYNRIEKRSKKLQNIIFEHVPNVSMNMSVTCPSKSVERVPRTAMNVSRGRPWTCPEQSVLYVPQTRILVANAENLSFGYLRNLLKRVRVRVHDILSNVSLIFSRTCPEIFSRTCPRTCPPTCPPTCPQAIQKYQKIRKYCVFCEKNTHTSRKRSSQKWTLLKSRFYSKNILFHHFFPNRNFEIGVKQMSLNVQTG